MCPLVRCTDLPISPRTWPSWSSSRQLSTREPPKVSRRGFCGITAIRKFRGKAVRMSGRTVPDAERLLTPAEVAAMFRVDPKTVTRWARDGRLTSVRTLGGHRRYRESEVLALLRAARGDQESEAGS